MIGTEGHNSHARRGFEHCQIGQRLRTAGRTIDLDDVLAFAALSGDRNPRHVNAAAAAAGPFRQQTVPGLLITSVAIGLLWESGFVSPEAALLASMSWRLKSPMFVGETVHLEGTVTDCQVIPGARGRGLVTIAGSAVCGTRIAQRGLLVFSVEPGCQTAEARAPSEPG